MLTVQIFPHSTARLSTPPYTPHYACPENSNITNVSKASRKMISMYVSVYITQPPFTAKISGEKCGLYTVKYGML